MFKYVYCIIDSSKLCAHLKCDYHHQGKMLGLKGKKITFALEDLSFIGNWPVTLYTH